MELDSETDEEDDEGFLKRDTSFVDVETCFHLLRWCADTCHAASYELDDEADYVEEDEDGCEGAGFEVEEAVGGDVEVDHAAEDYVGEGVHPLWVVSEMILMGKS
mgnify:FL=1